MDFDFEIPRLSTLVIELDYIDYKNQLLQALFNIYGDLVLETLIHPIVAHEDAHRAY